MSVNFCRDRHLTVLLLHEEYQKENPDGYRYTQFKKAIRDYQYAYNLCFHNEYIPGDELQIDFAGGCLYATDIKTGVKTRVVLLCCILPYSGLGYAKVMYDATRTNRKNKVDQKIELYFNQSGSLIP